MEPIAKQKNMANRIKDLETESKEFQLKYQRERRKGKNKTKEIKRLRKKLRNQEHYIGVLWKKYDALYEKTKILENKSFFSIFKKIRIFMK